MEAIIGVEKELKFSRHGVCVLCHGSKCKPGTGRAKCTGCGGKGFVNFRQGAMKVQMKCSKCKGDGVCINNPCPKCHGRGKSTSEVTEKVQFPKGIDSGQVMVHAKKGNISEIDGSIGNLICKVKIAPHLIFKRKDHDIHSDVKITISQVSNKESQLGCPWIKSKDSRSRWSQSY